MRFTQDVMDLNDLFFEQLCIVGLSELLIDDLALICTRNDHQV